MPPSFLIFYPSTLGHLTLAVLLFLKNTEFPPTSGHLHSVFSVQRMLFFHFHWLHQWSWLKCHNLKWMFIMCLIIICLFHSTLMKKVFASLYLVGAHINEHMDEIWDTVTFTSKYFVQKFLLMAVIYCFHLALEYDYLPMSLDNLSKHSLLQNTIVHLTDYLVLSILLF